MTPGLVDWKSLAFITALMLTSKGLELSGVFGRLAPRLIALSRGSEARLTLILLLMIALSSAFIMNDTAMLVFIPLIVELSRFLGLNRARLVVLSAIAANVGSALTPIGNPQNIIIWKNYGVGFLDFTLHMMPFVSIWFGALLLALPRGGRFDLMPMPPVALRSHLLVLSAILLASNIALAETGHYYIAFLLTSGAYLIADREPFMAVDWALVMTFAFIFIDFRELALLLPLHPPCSEEGVVLYSTLLSQVIGNVPATVLLSTKEALWLPLAVGVNAGGVGFITGSLANLIAVRAGRISLQDFHRLSVPYFILFVATSVVAFAF